MTTGAWVILTVGLTVGVALLAVLAEGLHQETCIWRNRFETVREMIQAISDAPDPEAAARAALMVIRPWEEE